MIAVASFVFGGLSIALGLSPNVWVFFGFMLVVGLAVPFFSTPAMTLLQLRVEPEKQGRVFGFVGIVMAVAMPLGMVIFGPLADQLPVQRILVGAGVLTFIVVALALAVPAGREALREGAVEMPSGNAPAEWKPGADNVPTTKALESQHLVDQADAGGEPLLAIAADEVPGFVPRVQRILEPRRSCRRGTARRRGCRPGVNGTSR